MEKRWLEIAQQPGELEHILGDYDPPAGKKQFRETIAAYLRTKLGWDIGSEHVGICSGSQAGYFTLFNILAGGGKRIAFPLVPEYIGYADQILEENALHAWKPIIEHGDLGRFTYGVDWNSLEHDWPNDIAALCLSRPTNPTARFASNDEVTRLHQLAAANNCYFMLDNAYGLPFPGVVFEEDAALPKWDRHLICSFSLSKLGLPTTRTGIIVAEPAIIQALTAANARIGLANGSIGQGLIEPLIASGKLTAYAGISSNPSMPSAVNGRCSILIRFSKPKELTMPCTSQVGPFSCGSGCRNWQ